MTVFVKTIAGCIAVAAMCGLFAAAAQGEVKVEKVPYFGEPNCYKLSNGTVEAIVTTDIGPRVIRYGLVGGDNMFAELPNDFTQTAFGKWRPMGGARLWHAPEAMPRSYWPDESPVKYELLGANGIRLTQDTEKDTGIQKEITVTLDDTGSGVTVEYKLTNHNLWAIDMAPWALTIMHGGGESILPEEPYRSHDEDVLPARPMVLWHYTDMSDPRFTWGKKYIRMKSDKSNDAAEKIGIGNKQGWAGYLRGKTLYVKRYNYVEGREYPDYGCSSETYTKNDFIELETVGPMAHVQAEGSAEMTERWYLFDNVDVGATEASLDAAITPLIAASPAPK